MLIFDLEYQTSVFEGADILVGGASAKALGTATAQAIGAKFALAITKTSTYAQATADGTVASSVSNSLAAAEG